MSDTPRTDQERDYAKTVHGAITARNDGIIGVSFARTLERELSERDRRIAELQTERARYRADAEMAFAKADTFDRARRDAVKDANGLQKELSTATRELVEAKAEIARLREDVHNWQTGNFSNTTPKGGDSKCAAHVEKPVEATLIAQSTDSKQASNAAHDTSEPSVERPQRKHLVESAGYWYRASHSKGYNDSAMAMEQAYNHTENALYAVTAERDQLKAENEKLRETLAFCIGVLRGARPTVIEEGSKQDNLDCAIVEAITRAETELAKGKQP